MCFFGTIIISIAKSTSVASYDKGDKQKKEIWLYECSQIYFFFWKKDEKQENQAPYWEMRNEEHPLRNYSSGKHFGWEL